MITITAQTELSELIDTNKIETETNRVKGVIIGELVESSQVVIKEQNSGALSTEFVNYSSVYYTKGATVIRYFNIVKDDLSSFAPNVINAAIKKELSELDELEAAVKAEQSKQETEYNSAYNNTKDDAAKTSIKNSYYGTNGTLTLLAKKLSDIGIRRNELSAKSATYSGDGDSNYDNDNRFNPNAGSGNETNSDGNNTDDENSTTSKDKTQSKYSKDEGNAGTNVKIDEINKKWKCSIVGYTSDGRAVYFDDMSSGKCYVKDENGNYTEVAKSYKDGHNIYTIDGKEWILSKTHKDSSTSAYEYSSIPTRYDTGEKFDYKGDDYKVIGYTNDGVKIYADNDIIKDYYTYDESTGNLVKLEPTTGENHDGYIVDKYEVNGTKYDFNRNLLDKNPNEN